MAFEKKVPQWNAVGAEPPESLKNSGFQPEYKPPADYFNWFWHATSEALKELQENGYPFTDIPANADLNDCTEVGWCFCGINARVATLANCPTTSAFFMQVGKHAGVYQRLVEYYSHSPRIYFRNKDDMGTWGAWQREYSTVDRPSPEDLGAAPESMLDRTYSVATSDELDAAINTVLNEMASHTVREFEISFTAAIQPFGGGTFLSKLYKVGDKYAVVEMRVYATGTPRTWIRSLFNGVWKDWACLSDSTHTHSLPDMTGILPVSKGGTGKNSLTEVTAGYAIHPVMINCSNLDINELKSAGFYFGYTGMTNAAAPSEISVIEVISYSTDWLLQRQTRLTDGRTWCRYFYSGSSWSDWYRIYTSKDKPSATDIGAANTAFSNIPNISAALDNINVTNNFYGTIGAEYTFDSALKQAEYSVAGKDVAGAPYSGDIYGKLVVFVNGGDTHDNASNWIWQVFYSTLNASVYLRNKVNNGAWNAWSKMYNYANKPTPSDIGAARIETGSYDGVWSSSAKDSLVLPFDNLPRVLFLEGFNTILDFAVLFPQSGRGLLFRTTANVWPRGINFSTSGNNVVIPFDDNIDTIGQLGITYTYTAIE